MTDATYFPPTPAKAKLRFKISKHEPPSDPGRTTSWDVEARRLLVFWVHLGRVNANGKADALTKARSKFPNERRLRVCVGE